ncbi:hypothetical protein SLE2022_135090 [Rubroshorea leprosula]
MRRVSLRIILNLVFLLLERTQEILVDEFVDGILQFLVTIYSHFTWGISTAQAYQYISRSWKGSWFSRKNKSSFAKATRSYLPPNFFHLSFTSRNMKCNNAQPSTRNIQAPGQFLITPFLYIFGVIALPQAIHLLLDIVVEIFLRPPTTFEEHRRQLL